MGNNEAVTDRGPAIWATALALTLVNLGLALLIVEVVGAGGFVPLWVDGLILIVGLAAAGGAIRLWRKFLEDARQG